MLATTVAIGKYVAQSRQRPAVVLGSSFGHYTSLVMVGALEYEQALETVQANGRTIDQYLATMQSLVIKGIPYNDIAELATRLELPFPPQQENEGTVLTFPNDRQSEIERFIAAKDGEATQIPVRPPFHTQAISPVEEQIQANLKPLRLSHPSEPVLSSYSADYIRNAPDAEETLRHEMSAPHLIKSCLRKIKQAGIGTLIKMHRFGFIEKTI